MPFRHRIHHHIPVSARVVPPAHRGQGDEEGEEGGVGQAAAITSRPPGAAGRLAAGGRGRGSSPWLPERLPAGPARAGAPPKYLAPSSLCLVMRGFPGLQKAKGWLAADLDIPPPGDGEGRAPDARRVPIP